MAVFAGVDGCPGGWVAAVDRGGAIEIKVFSRLADLLEIDEFDFVAVDIPIGLTDQGRRPPDVAGRKVMGPRVSSMMPAPIRAAAYAHSRAEADAITRAADGRGVAAQAFGIYPKVAEVDTLMRASALARKVVVETHPEVGFALWAGAPMTFSKKTSEGASARRSLVEKEFGPLPAWPHPRRIVQPDDVLDAFACLWTARRIAAGTAFTFAGKPSHDSEGLPMRIVV